MPHKSSRGCPQKILLHDTRFKSDSPAEAQASSVATFNRPARITPSANDNGVRPRRQGGSEMIVVTGASGLLGGNMAMAARRRRDDLVAAYPPHAVHFHDTKVTDPELSDPRR